MSTRTHTQPVLCPSWKIDIPLAREALVIAEGALPTQPFAHLREYQWDIDASAAMGAASDADSDAVAREAAGVAQQLAQMPPRPTNPRTAGLS
eukprot:CAMPEP_0196778364 /NCGR_PEP_ID=MMETSP1104-20130614/5758_1 /TAXON_ID=33652 /ORGANISM="Cafeteria sp., Strain Caron Lab Isolate" /LENGTH=92 /DNA_ID=CAMNT_0042148533 /DNA_START=134 /DNA_END=413 /DNA_ORIENTATION=+